MQGFFYGNRLNRWQEGTVEMKNVQDETIARLNANMLGRVSGGLANELKNLPGIFMLDPEPIKHRDMSRSGLKTRFTRQIRSFHV
jgi:hypothetical protein